MIHDTIECDLFIAVPDDNWQLDISGSASSRDSSCELLALAAALWWWIGRQPLRPATPGL